MAGRKQRKTPRAGAGARRQRASCGPQAWGREGRVWSKALSREPEATPCAGCVLLGAPGCVLSYRESVSLPCPSGQQKGWGAHLSLLKRWTSEVWVPTADAALERSSWVLESNARLSCPSPTGWFCDLVRDTSAPPKPCTCADRAGRGRPWVPTSPFT